MLFCKKCKRMVPASNFYKSHNLEKYPNGQLDICKKCLTMHVDNWDPETYLWILQECDVPYIPDEWDKLLAAYGKDRSKVTGLTIIGRYLAKMCLSQFKQYRWSDTDFLRQLNSHKITEAMKQQGYGIAQITQVLNEKEFKVAEGGYEEPEIIEPQYSAPQPYAANDDSVDLTEEDKTYLRLKWGRAYKPEEWVRLEQLYQEMEQSYDIQGAGHEDVLKMVCKTSLKANQLLDLGDVDGAQKMVKMYDMLMKSGKFSPSQNKGEDGDALNSISEFASICEKDGFIPRFYIESPNDKVDETIWDLKNYTRSLVTDEMNLGNLIENAVKEMTLQESKEEDEDVEEELTLDSISALKDEDFEAFNDFVEDEQRDDADILEQFLSENYNEEEE